MEKSLKENSRGDWSAPDDSYVSTIEQVRVGSLQRIADATEKMATNFLQLQGDVEHYKKKYFASIKRQRTLERSNNALRGYIKKLKNKQ